MFSWGIAVATGSDAALEWRVESLRRTPAAVRETIATNWALEIDELVESVVTLEVNVPLSLIKVWVIPEEANGFCNIAKRF